MNTLTTTKTITRSGGALVLNVTKEVKTLGLTHGDTVEIVIRKVRE